MFEVDESSKQAFDLKVAPEAGALLKIAVIVLWTASPPFAQPQFGTQAQFAAEITKLQSVIRNSEARIRELKRGERLARATESAQRLNNTLPGGLSTLKEAEATLDRLRNRQRQIDLTAAVLMEMDNATDPSAIIGKLADAGCGTPLRTTGDDVIARLRARMNNAA